MKRYIFTKDNDEIEVEAGSYKEALEALIFRVGSEAEAATYIFKTIL